MKPIRKFGLRLLALLLAAPTLSACGDFFEQDSDHLIYTDDQRLDNASDTIYSVLGIVNKLQAIADRTILLGEVRGDLVDVTSTTSSDLRNVAMFNVGSDNAYNSPRDYYAVINNCNYFLANADTALKNNSNQYIFQKEYAAVKAYRAWTYLQLALNYGRVPFVTTPILTKDDAERDYERKDIKGICEYFASDIAPYASVEKPSYGTIRGVDSKYFYFPIHILMGDLYLWSGNYREAALSYYKYISTCTGGNVIQPTGPYNILRSNLEGTMTSDRWSLNCFDNEGGTNFELITLLPGDSIPAEGNYSQLRNLFNTTSDNDYKASLTPSDTLKNLSDAQVYCYVNTAGNVFYPTGSTFRGSKGDLRLSAAVETSNMMMSIDGNRRDIDYQTVVKYSTRNVHIYRMTMVYMRMAEALNRAGYPEVAFKVLETGLNNSVIDGVIAEKRADGTYTASDSAWLKQFDFPNTSIIICTPSNSSLTSSSDNAGNTTGIHTHGSGWSAYNEYYTLPTAATRDELVEKVEDMLMDEEALEFAFEGHRFYDLMRIALRRNDPGYLAGHVYGRRGAAKVGEMKSLIQKDLTQPANWYLDWNGQIGIQVGE